MALLLLVVLCWLGLVVLWIAMLLDVARRPDEAYNDVGRSRAVTLALVFFAGWIGAIYYYFVIREQLAEAERR